VHGHVKLTNFAVAYSKMEGRLATVGPLLKGDIAYSSPEYLMLQPLDAAQISSLSGGPPGDADRQALLDLPEVEQAMRMAEAPNPAQAVLQSETQSWLPAPEMAMRMERFKPEHVERATLGLSSPMRDIVIRTLRRDPSERFQSGLELRDELWSFLGSSGAATAPGRCTREVSRVRMRPFSATEERSSQRGGLPEHTPCDELAQSLVPEAWRGRLVKVTGAPLRRCAGPACPEGHEARDCPACSDVNELHRRWCVADGHADSLMWNRDLCAPSTKGPRGLPAPARGRGEAAVLHPCHSGLPLRWGLPCVRHLRGWPREARRSEWSRPCGRLDGSRISGRRSEGQVRITTTAALLEDNLAHGRLSAVLGVEEDTPSRGVWSGSPSSTGWVCGSWPDPPLQTMNSGDPLSR